MVDPRADIAFESLATAFCSGAEAFLPIPRTESLPNDPLFLSVWKRVGTVNEIQNAALSDEAFLRIGGKASKAFATFAEGEPWNVARFIALEFSDALQSQNLQDSDCAGAIQAAPLAQELIRDNCLPRLTDALLTFQRDFGLREPRQYTHLIGNATFESLIHFAISYSLGISLRGWSYAANIALLTEEPVYRYAWIRSPALGVNISGKLERLTEDCPSSWFPWGSILRYAFDPENPLLKRDTALVSEVLVAIRESSANLPARVCLGTKYPEHAPPTDAEVLVLDILRGAGVLPRYADTTRAEILSRWLREIIRRAAPFLELPAELITSATQTKWLRGIEFAFRLRFRRDTLWDVFEEPGVRRSLKTMSPAETNLLLQE